MNMPIPNDSRHHTDREIEDQVELRDCPFCGKQPTAINCGDYTDVVCCMSEMMGDGIWNKRPIEDKLRHKYNALLGFVASLPPEIKEKYDDRHSL